MNSAQVLRSVHAAIEDFNQIQAPGQQLGKSPETVLLGSAAKLDSLGLVSFLVTVEQRLAADYGAPITLASERAFSLRNSPFVTIGALTSYIETLLQERP